MFRRLVSLKSVVLIVGLLVVLAHSLPVYAEWEFQDSGMTGHLYDICFVNELYGWVVGDNSTIIRTTDGGDTWVKLEYPKEGYTFECVEFVDDQVGYIFGNDWHSDNPTYTSNVLITYNGGESWEDITPANENYIGFRDLAVIDENTCWITALVSLRGRILHTKDGGKSWDIQIVDQHSYPYEFGGIDFIDKDTGWALNTIGTDTMGKVNIYKTVNGGVDWTEISVVDSDYNQNKIIAVNKDILWMCNPFVHVSSDSGNTWSLLDKRYPNTSVRDVYPLTDTEAYVLFTNSLAFTDDGGHTFDTVMTNTSVGSSFFSSIDGIRGRHVWCLRFAGQIIKYTPDETSIEKTELRPQLTELTNSPNPFNTSTVVSFTLESDDSVELSVYDILGQKLQTLLKSDLQSGSYSVHWNGKNAQSSSSSGIYFAVLKTSKGIVTKKMILLR